MKSSPMKLETIMKIARNWAEIGGKRKIELGALEPLLWRDGKDTIDVLVKTLVSEGFEVAMTSNGQLLTKFAEKLAESGLSLLRCSWHTTDEVLFKELSGGYGNYKLFKEGLELAAQSGIKIDFNRLLTKNNSDDFAEQVEFLTKYGSRLKLLTLLWTEESQTDRPSLYQDWRPVVRKHILPHTVQIKRLPQKDRRSRLKFVLEGKGSVEVKYHELINREITPCKTCLHKNECEESFMDYVRVASDSHIYFCYLRRDLGFNFAEVVGQPSEFLLRMQTHSPEVNLEEWMRNQSLRLTLMPVCNFNCRVPGSMNSWCSEKHQSHQFPKMKPSVMS